MKNKPEELLQKSIMQYHEWVKNTLPKKTDLKSNRNESGKSGIVGIIAGKHYNEMGRKKGEPDLELLIEGGKVIFIELKTKDRCITKTGKETKSQGLSQEQIDRHKTLCSLGFEVHLIYELEQFIELLKNI